MIDMTEAPKMNITLPKMDIAELVIMAKWADLKRGTFPHLASWLADLFVNEIARREFPDMEPSMESLPNWNGEELADALVGSHVLTHFPMSEAQAAFADQLHQHCMANAAAALQTFSPEVAL